MGFRFSPPIFFHGSICSVNQASAQTLFLHNSSGLGDEVVAMSSLSRELVFLILQFLDEEKFKETVHKLEQESGFFL